MASARRLRLVRSDAGEIPVGTEIRFDMGQGEMVGQVQRFDPVDRVLYVLVPNGGTDAVTGRAKPAVHIVYPERIIR